MLFHFNQVSHLNQLKQMNQPKQIDINKVFTFNVKKIVLSTYYKEDVSLIKQRADNTYYDKIIKI